jgi:membrane-bound serine protease (ClpP class)
MGPRFESTRRRGPATLAGLALLSLACCAPASAFPAAAPAVHIALVEIAGPIGPATAGYLQRAERLAGQRGDACLVVRLDTPGGLLESTQQIVRDIYASPVPVVVWVAPAGANAGSAGCFITLAADIAAMAPATSIGAAHPVSIGGAPGNGEQSKPDDVMKQKLENFAASYIEAIAQKRGRNVEWARASVLQSASITAEQALALGVIDLLAADRDDLLRQLDGRRVGERALSVAGATFVVIPPSLRERVFQMIWRPEVMFILMLVAIYGLVGELSHPGAILPGVAGAIALVLALYLASILPVNAAGLALVGLAAVLFVVDLFAPTHGLLTAGGLVAFALGALLLFDRGDPAFALSLRLIVPGVLLTAVFFGLVVGKGLRAQRLPARTGREAMLGQTVRALGPLDAGGGKVLLDGEIWNAVADGPIAEGEAVVVTAIDGLTLRVRRGA